MILTFNVKTEKQLAALAAELSSYLTQSCCITLSGQLGAGKTTFTRALLYALGYEGTVKSPTFTVVETYAFKNYLIYHFDLYRIHDPEELELMGIRDYFQDNPQTQRLILIEWPEQVQNCLPKADIDCSIRVQGMGREITFAANTGVGHMILKQLKCHETPHH